MRYIFYIIFALSISKQFFSQKKESVSFFDLKFKAKEVTGQKIFSGVPDAYRSKILNPLIEKNENEYLNNVGKIRKNTASTEVSNLFDLSSQKTYYKILDEINFDFYEAEGWDLLIEENPHLLNNSLYNELREKISSVDSIKSKKEILFRDKYREIRKKLINTRLEIRSKVSP